MKHLLGHRRRVCDCLPPPEEILRGSVYTRRVRCGKPGCHCAKGAGHEVTYLSVTLPSGRTEQISLPKSLVPVATQWVRNYHAWWEGIETISAINRDILRKQRPKRRRRSVETAGRRRPKR